MMATQLELIAAHESIMAPRCTGPRPDPGSPAWNPRFVAYAAAHGRTPDAQTAHDDAAYPGGHMAGFILWASERDREARRG